MENNNANVEDNDYHDISNLPITPIMDADKKREKNKAKTRILKTTSTATEKTSKGEAATKRQVDRSRSRKRIGKGKVKHSVPLDVFYRRQFDESTLNTPMEWMQCQDLITPYYTGQKTKISPPKRILIKDPLVMRFIQLLSMNAKNQTKEDVYSIMYQISNIQLRFFQWDIAAMKLLLNVILKDNRHSFANLKHGLKSIFTSWSLDLSNTTNLLKQTRIFRPPCIFKPDYEASTKSSKTMRFTKSVTPKKYCDYDTEDCSD
ncbi:uncharacterized protein LOC119629147 [Bombyx mori]|uniref:Uncharacterized protein n=1 Tax=Bombyx mori TaxID=7091 RepID=A0A8R2LYQ5_BOMMO|nr:uncharacterized protein LOC119629147 [Bombyx mori]